MTENNNLTYEAWEKYLKSDKEMGSKRESLTELWKNVKKELKENLNSLPHSEAFRRRKFLTARNIFNIINTAKEKPNFAWNRKLIYNEKDERDEWVIQCLNPSSDYLFRKIKEERGVASMRWESINKYLQPVADKIWALKEILRASIQTETKPSDLSYESMKTIVEDENTVWEKVEPTQILKWELPSKKESVQLTIEFPEDDSDDVEIMERKEDYINMDELYKFDPENENWWNR